MRVGEYQKPRNEENVMAHSHDKVSLRGYEPSLMTVQLLDV